MTGRLDGHVAVITGAAGGIGSAVARRFTLEGCRVIATDITMPTDGEVNLITDASDEQAVFAAAEAVRAAGLAPSIIMHAAAFGARRATLETDGDFLARMVGLNAGGALALARAFGPDMRERKRGAFLFVSSINSTFATPGLAAYAASKAALDSLTRTLALEFAPDRVRVNAIRPASIDTPMLQSGFAAQTDPDAARRSNILRHPLGRLGTADDVAALALFLCSDEASWITGVDYLIDGGAAITRR